MLVSRVVARRSEHYWDFHTLYIYTLQRTVASRIWKRMGGLVGDHWKATVTLKNITYNQNM